MDFVIDKKIFFFKYVEGRSKKSDKLAGGLSSFSPCCRSRIDFVAVSVTMYAWVLVWPENSYFGLVRMGKLPDRRQELQEKKKIKKKKNKKKRASWIECRMFRAVLLDT